jgi:hypothetical protein
MKKKLTWLGIRFCNFIFGLDMKKHIANGCPTCIRWMKEYGK